MAEPLRLGGTSRSRPWRSVRWRITLLATALVGVTLALAAYLLVSSVERRLTDRARQEAAQALDQTQGELAAGQSVDKITGLLPLGSPYLQIYGSDGRVVMSGPGTPATQLFTIDGFGHPVPVAGLTTNRLVVETRRISSNNGPLTLVAASSLDEVRRSVSTLASSLWLGIPLVVLAVGMVSWWLVGRALRPVERMRREVEDISHTTLHRRIDEPTTGDEVARLAHTMNVMLDRLETAQTKQRQFVSDASHELRSPLTTIRTSVEVAKLHPEAVDWPQVATTVLNESERLDGLVSDLLDLAKLDETSNGEHGARRGHVDVDELVLDDVARLQRLGYTVRAEGVSAARVDGDGRQLAKLVRNLLDNAARHAASAVTVTLSEDSTTACLRVDDDGPGIPAEDRDRVFERFTRLDESRLRQTGGSGLGLALVKAIAEGHGGSVTALASPSGGARFEVRLPLHEPFSEMAHLDPDPVSL